MPPLSTSQPTGRFREVDAKRGTAARRGYGYKWQLARERFLARPENVLCLMCQAEGRTVEASVVDHITPHRGDPALFWSESNWQPLCASHHSGAKQQIEAGGRLKGADLSGRPIDPAHPWNRSEA